MLGCAVVLVLWLGGREVLTGQSARFTLVHELGNRRIPESRPRCKLDGSMSVGQFVSFSTYMMQLTWPVIALGWVINIFQRGTASLIRINEIMQEAARNSGCSRRPRPRDPRARSNFAHLNFNYEGKQVLHDVNLQIPAGTQPRDCRSDRIRQDHAGRV